MSAPLSRRERKRQRTRVELIDAARSLIAERGVTELRVSDVTDRTDVALGTFYSHFQTKEQIVEAVITETVSLLTNLVADIGDQLDDPAEAVSVGVRQMVGLAAFDPELARVLVRLTDAEPRFESILWPRAERIMRRGAESGRFRVDDVTLSLKIAIASVFATLRTSMESAYSIDPAHACAVAVLQGVGIPYDEAGEIAARPMPAISIERRSTSGEAADSA